MLLIWTLHILKLQNPNLTFGIFNYEKIKDHVHLLEGTGKNMRHIKIKKYEDLQPEVIKTWIRKITTLD